MKKLFICLAMALVSLNIMADTDEKEYRTYVKNDHMVFYCTHQGITVIVDPTEDGLFEPHITIINESGHDFIFKPQQITVQAYAIPGNTFKGTRYRVERYLAKGDSSYFEKDKLKLYTPAKHAKKHSNTMWWSSFLTEMAVASIEAIGENDARQQYWNDVRREKRIDKDADDRQHEITRINEGYWRANTIFNGSEHEGFIGIKPIKSQFITLDIPVDGENFHFLIHNKKYEGGE